MKRIIFTVLFSISTIGLMATGDGYRVKFAQPDEGNFLLTFELGDYLIDNEIIDNTTYATINFEGSIRTTDKGYASLPYIHASVQLSGDRNVTLSILESDYTDIKLDYPLLPSRGVIYRDEDPSSVPYKIDPASITDELYPGELARNTDPFIIRDIRGTSVYVYPFRYNPLKNTLRIYHKVKVVLEENNEKPINPLLKTDATIVREMDAVYRSVFINYGQNRDDLTIGEIGDILVIYTERDEDAIEPYIQWKKEKGYNVSTEEVPPGTNVESLIQQAYDDNNDLLYVQLVGDWDDIKSETLGSAPMDPQLGCVAGADDFADICIGRISANDTSHVTVQVDKIINYEKYPEPGGTWYETATGIGSDEGPGDDSEMDYEHLDVIYDDKLDPFTYESYNDIYAPAASQSMITNAVNAGTGIINYTGHGSPFSWGTTGFSNSSLSTLTNADRLPVIISVACNNGEFNISTGDCFAEAWVKKENGGAVMFLGATISQPWNPPMRGQDYFMDVLIGGYDYTAHAGQNGINTTEQRTTLGTYVFNGLTLMCTESSGSQDWETAKTWTLFGDPAMQMRTAPPDELNVSNTTIIAGLPFQTTVTGSNGAVEGAMVAISQGDAYNRGFTNENGFVEIEHSFIPGTALLVITGFNTETIYQTIDVIPANGPYIIYAYHEVNDPSGNGNGMLDYGESVTTSIALANIGSEDVINVSVLLSTSDEYTELTDSTENYGTIPAGDTLVISDGFAFDVSAGVPDMHAIDFELTSEGDQTWNSSFTDMAHAPVLLLGDIVIDDPAGNGNGRLDAGESADITVNIENHGSSEAYNVIGDLLSNSVYVTVEGSSLPYGNISGGDTAQQTYTVVADDATPIGHPADFTFDATADLGISLSDTFLIIVGQIPILIVDLDGNQNSAGDLMTCCENLGITAHYATSIPENPELYSSIFVCLGVFQNNYALTQAEGQALADFLEDGGMLYMEGGDTWYYDDQTPVHPMFNINGESDGSNNLDVIEGMEGTMTAGMDFNYSGDNSYIDKISAIEPAELIFVNNFPVYGCAVAHDAGDYKTIGASFEFGGLEDGENTKDDLMLVYLDFFDLDGLITGINSEFADAGLHDIRNYPNPFENNMKISFTLNEADHVTIDIYNLSGQKLAGIVDRRLPSGTHTFEWDGRNASGEHLSGGMYLYRILTSTGFQTGNLVKMR